MQITQVSCDYIEYSTFFAPLADTRFVSVSSQFVIDLGVVYFASYVHWAGKLTPKSIFYGKLPQFGKCAGEEYAAISGMVCLTSYLFLFLSFYARTYKKVGSKKEAAKKVAVKGTVVSNGSPKQQ